jgi:Pentapeptide repeats (8 copies)
MGGRRRQGATSGRRDDRLVALPWTGRPGPAAVLLFLGLLLLLPHLGHAQGNPAVIFRQMQARLAALNTMVQRQQAMIQQLNRDHAADAARLQQFQAAVNAAAAAGDPTARAVRSANGALALEKLTTQFQTRARPTAPGTAAGSTQAAVPDLSGARLRDAALPSAKLANAKLSGADLTNADLSHAVLTGADLRGAKLQGATLTGADLTNADLKDALYDAKTRWPPGFDARQHAALLVQ